nr:MAG TPA: hypothetical protein [Caudoviricetes sp.]
MRYNTYELVLLLNAMLLMPSSRPLTNPQRSFLLQIIYDLFLLNYRSRLKLKRLLVTLLVSFEKTSIVRS